jgi:hypothetical protein
VHRSSAACMTSLCTTTTTTTIKDVCPSLIISQIGGESTYCRTSTHSLPTLSNFEFLVFAAPSPAADIL